MGYYMTGDYYRGDPGLGSFFGSLISKAAGFIPGVGPIASRVAEKIIPHGGGGAATLGNIVKAGKGAIMKHPVITAAGAAGVLGAAAGVGGARLMAGGGACHVRPGHRPLKHGGQVLKSGKIGKCYRSMNVCNSRALRRALRRAHGFANFAMKCIRLTHPHKKGRFGGFKHRTRKKCA